MTVKNELANGNTEIFETDNYIICKPENFHPLILKVEVFSNGKKIKSVSRRHKWYYKHFTFHTEKVQEELRKIQAEGKIES
jgi:hypothetical protein